MVKHPIHERIEIMPAGYEKPEHKSNADKAKEAEKKPYVNRPTGTDHGKIKPPKKDGG